jgi:hypothetical protein
MHRLKASTGFSSQEFGLCSQACSMSASRGRTQLLLFSTGVNRSVGNREQSPWPTSEATVSMIGRPWWPVKAWKPDRPLNGVISPSRTPSHSLV